MIKKFTYTITSLLFHGILAAQPDANTCDAPNAYTTIYANNIKAGLLNGGDLFWDFNDPQFIPNPSPSGPAPSTIFAAGLWVGGVDPAGNLKLAAQTYRVGGTTDFWAGPLNSDGTTDALTCSNWDRFFTVKGAEVKDFLDNLPELINNSASAIAQYPNIMGWPAAGNPYFHQIRGFSLPTTPDGLAGFHDADNNDLYDPLKGDYPAVRLDDGTVLLPAEIAWCVFNDQGSGAVHSSSNGKPLQIEVQLTTWAFHCTEQPVLENSVFTAHRIINRSAERLDSCFIGLFVDFNIGCFTDDYVGCDPTQSTFFAYNQDNIDGTSGNICDQNMPAFTGLPPVQSVTMLNRPMDRFMYYNNPSIGVPPLATVDPDLVALAYYQYLTGRWKDGVPLSYGGTGYLSGGVTTNHAFPGEPGDPNAWSMCTANLPAGDPRVAASTQTENLLPGQVAELVTAWTVHPEPDLPCGLGNTKDEILLLRSIYQNNFSGVCSPLTGVSEVMHTRRTGIFPNPASGTVTLTYDDLPIRKIRLFNALGQLAADMTSTNGQVSLEGLPEGLYQVQLLSPDNIVLATQPLQIIRR